MSSEDIITAYENAVPKKQKQDLPGSEKHLAPNAEHSKVEVWGDNGQPILKEYQGSAKLRGKTAIITGGDSGIGRAAAILFARESCAGITITYLPEEEQDAKDAKKLVEQEGSQALAIPVDLMNIDGCERVVESHVAQFGRLDVLVNNASKQIFCKNFEEIDLNNVMSTFQSNIIQMFAVTKFALRHMKRGSSIINTTSVTAYAGSPMLVDYSSTKGAIVSFTRALAVQLAPKGIRVNAVAPGPVITPLQPASRSEENMEEFGVGMPLHGRAAQPAELAPAFVFLASSADSNVMTGHVLHLNNGKHIGGS